MSDFEGSECAVCARFHEMGHLVGGNPARACPQCGKVFTVLPLPGRPPKWCSDACRQAAYRARRAVRR